MNKISASVLAGLFVVGLAACSTEPTNRTVEFDPPPVATTDSSSDFHNTGCARRTPPNTPCPR